jgi:hypothetical protein
VELSPDVEDVEPVELSPEVEDVELVELSPDVVELVEPPSGGGKHPSLFGIVP